MNRLILFLWIGISSLMANGQGRESLYQLTPPKAIKWNPLGLTVGSISLQYEKGISRDQSICAYGYFGNYMYGGDVFFAGLAIGYRSYYEASFQKGWYAEPFIKYQYVSIPQASGSFNTVSAGFLGGRKWNLGQHICTEMYLGPSYNFGAVDEGNGSVPIPDWLGPINGIFVRMGANIGWRY
jgi:hypothetical protein